MTKQVFLEYENGVRAVATLFEDLAPRTCEAMWGALEKPVTMQAMHAMYAGPEVMVGLPKRHRTSTPRRCRSRTSRSCPHRVTCSGTGSVRCRWAACRSSGTRSESSTIVVPVLSARSDGHRQHLGRHHRRTRGIRQGERAIRIDGAKQLTIGRWSKAFTQCWTHPEGAVHEYPKNPHHRGARRHRRPRPRRLCIR